METKIGIIGVGRLGSALLKGLKGKGLSLHSLDRGKGNTDEAKMTQGYEEMASCKVVFLCVKPKDISEAADGIGKAIRKLEKHPLIISVAAGKTIGFLEGKFPNERIIRAIPNIAASVSKSITCYSTNRHATSKDIILAKTIFSSIGECIPVPEDSLDAATALGGSGPAYYFYFTKKLAVAGNKLGLDMRASQAIARAVLVGAAAIADSSKDSMDELIANIATPGGTTEAALKEFESGNIGNSIEKGLSRAKEKCKQIGEMQNEKL